MKNLTGFLDVERHDRRYRPVAERLKDWDEFVEPLPEPEVRRQAERCMDCGVPFCHTGCPVNNLIPDWNDLVTGDQWRAALERLHRTNNFPEFTGRICPAPCEAACTLNLDDDPVTIKTIECEIVDRGWREGWIEPHMAPRGTGQRHRDRRLGAGRPRLRPAAGADGPRPDRVREGRPDRRPAPLRHSRLQDGPDADRPPHRARWRSKGVIFRTSMEIGVTVPVERLMDDYHVLVLAGGAEQPRDLPVPGPRPRRRPFRDGLSRPAEPPRRRPARRRASRSSPTGKHVVVIGGGDTGSDCIGTANRQGALSVTQLEILPEPPLARGQGLTWPHWPMKLRTSSSQEEGARPRILGRHPPLRRRRWPRRRAWSASATASRSS